MSSPRAGAPAAAGRGGGSAGGAGGGAAGGGGAPARPGGAAGDAVGELADGGGLVREPAAVPVEALALAGDLGGAGGHLAALVLDPALGLVLLGVLQAGQAALQGLAVGSAGLPVRLRRPSRADGDAAGRGGPRQQLRVVGGGVGPGLHPVE